LILTSVRAPREATILEIRQNVGIQKNIALKRIGPCLVAGGLVLGACDAEPRFTLWRIRDAETVKVESGLERQACEAKRDRAEAEAYAASDQQARRRRELIALGGTPARPAIQPHYRCRPDGED
jgi:hypothetical protein